MTRLRATISPDSYGDPVESWETPSRFDVPGAELTAPTSTENETPTADELHNGRRFTAPGAVDLKASDRIEVSGETWRVDGDPVVRSGFALGVYTTADLRRFVARGAASG